MHELRLNIGPFRRWIVAAGALVLTLFLGGAAPICTYTPGTQVMNEEKWCCCGACCGWAVDCKAIPGCTGC